VQIKLQLFWDIFYFNAIDTVTVELELTATSANVIQKAVMTAITKMYLNVFGIVICCLCVNKVGYILDGC
jgi:hypothetical protein